MNGEILATFPNGHKFKGLFADHNVIPGQGTITFPTHIKGKCLSGDCINGPGKIKFSNSNVYEGELVNCSRHGTGSYTFTDGANYNGEFHQGKRHGKGIYTYPSGLTYEGRYKEGHREGEGIFTFPNGNTYKVRFRKGHLQK